MKTTTEQTQSDSTISRTGILIGVGIALLTGVLYLPSVGFDFINWDDPWYVLNNELIQSWSFSSLFAIFTQPVARNFAPLTLLSLSIDHTLWGLKPTGYHLTNVALHLVNALLVYSLVARLAGNRTVGWITAALFVAHPLQIETVAWVSSRKGLLSAAFILGALNCWMRPTTTGRQEMCGLLLFAGALLSKAIAIVIPPVVVLYYVLIVGKKRSEAIAQQFVPAIMSLMILLLTMNAQTTIVGGTRAHLALSKLQLFAVDAVILWKYIGMLLLPTDLCVMYDPATTGIAVATTFAILGWLAVAGLLYRQRNRQPWAVLLVGSFFLLLIPVLNLFPITTLMNDRYLYLPSIPFFGGIAAFAFARMHRLSAWLNDPEEDRLRRARVFTAVAATPAIVAFAVMTHNHLPVWQNSLSLWKHATRTTPTLPVNWIQLAHSMHDVGQHRQAIEVLANTQSKLTLDKADRARVVRMLQEWSDELVASQDSAYRRAMYQMQSQ